MRGRLLRILHISDVHFGKDASSGWRKRRVLGQAWSENLARIAADGPIDLVAFTGDIAQSGAADQYVQATAFVDDVLATLQVPRERFFCVPGNHDMDRNVQPEAWKKLRDAAWSVPTAKFGAFIAADSRSAPFGCEKEWPHLVLERQAAYQAWLATMGREALLPSRHAHGRLGYRVSLDVGLEAPLHIVGLDSGWLAGDDNDAGKLRLTDEQVGRLLTESDGSDLDGWKIALVHHPLGDLADHLQALGLLTERGVGLLMHGHMHDPRMLRYSLPSASLHVSAAGCLYESDTYPNSFQVIDLNLPHGEAAEPHAIWSRKWSDRGHWHDDDGFDRQSAGGRLLLGPPPPEPITFTQGEFIGRATELQSLCDALLPKGNQPGRPTVICCAVEGMAGVGKTRLAEEFLQQHWLPAMGQSPEADASPYCLRLVLDSHLSQAPMALELGQQLADRLRSTGPADTLWIRLAAALRNGANGVPLLLLIENVDAEPSAKAVGELVNRLPGCPILITARYQRLGGVTWARVPVAALTPIEARALLLAELDLGTPRPSDAEADQLVYELGGLPLALHIAASHLNHGLKAAEFLSEFKRLRLAMEPEPGDPRLTADRARAIVRSSFELSWRHWCRDGGADPAWQEALVALAHGPLAPTGVSLSATIAGLDDAIYAAFASRAARLSLLQFAVTDRRTVLHPLISEFLRQQPTPTEEQVRHRLSAWFLPRLPQSNDASQGRRWAEVWGELDALVSWLRAMPPEDGLLAARAGREFACLIGPYRAWQALCERLINANPEDSRQFDLLWITGHMARGAGDPERALAVGRDLTELARQQGEEGWCALGQGLVADVLHERGEVDEAMRIWQEELLPLYERLGKKRERAQTMGNIAEVLQDRGELDKAMDIWLQLALVFMELGDQREQAASMCKVAALLEVIGDLDEALRIRQDQLRVFERLGDQRARANTQSGIADVLRARGEWDEALRLLRQDVLPVFERLGDHRMRAATLSNIANVLQSQGNVNEALCVRRQEQLPLYEQLGDEREQATTMGKVAELLLARSEFDEAVRVVRQEVLPVLERLGEQRSLLVGRTNLAIMLHLRGNTEDRSEINSLLMDALATARRLRSRENAIVAWYQVIFGTVPPDADGQGN